jgi:hypothetical protein
LYPDIDNYDIEFPKYIRILYLVGPKVEKLSPAATFPGTTLPFQSCFMKGVLYECDAFKIADTQDLFVPGLMIIQHNPALSEYPFDLRPVE